MLKLTTGRLLMIPCSLHIAKAMVFHREYLNTFLLTNVPVDWPGDELKAFLPYYIEEIERDPSLLGWGVWILMDNARKTVVGDAGFKGKPDVFGTVEIGYRIHHDFRNSGYASEAALALINWAFAEDKDVQKIKAECDEENIPSIQVLQKLGMTRLPGKGPLLQWELKRM
ncbi:MAG TPA: GNAT family N-acetyltransferase [Bacillales bacterium]